MDAIFYSLGVSPNTYTDRNSAEYSRKLFEELQASLYIQRSLLSGIPSYELYLPSSPWTLLSSVFSTQGGYGLYLIISWVPLPELQPENSQRQRTEAITELTSFASISRDHCHLLLDVWCLELSKYPLLANRSLYKPLPKSFQHNCSDLKLLLCFTL